MANQCIHVSEGTFSALLETSEAVGGVDLEQVIAAAVRGFSQQEKEFKHWFIGDYVLGGRSNPGPEERKPHRRSRFHEMARRFLAALGWHPGW